MSLDNPTIEDYKELLAKKGKQICELYDELREARRDAKIAYNLGKAAFNEMEAAKVKSIEKDAETIVIIDEAMEAMCAVVFHIRQDDVEAFHAAYEKLGKLRKTLAP